MREYKQGQREKKQDGWGSIYLPVFFESDIVFLFVW